MVSGRLESHGVGWSEGRGLWNRPKENGKKKKIFEGNDDLNNGPLLVNSITRNYTEEHTFSETKRIEI